MTMTGNGLIYYNINTITKVICVSHYSAIILLIFLGIDFIKHTIAVKLYNKYEVNCLIRELYLCINRFIIE